MNSHISAGAFDKLDLTLQEELTAPIVEALDHVSKTHAVMEGTSEQDIKFVKHNSTLYASLMHIIDVE